MPENLSKIISSTEKKLQEIKTLKIKYKDHSVYEYITEMYSNQSHPLQDRNDVVSKSFNLTKGILGATVAKKLKYSLITNPSVQMANHHGVDYFSRSVQSNVILSTHAIKEKIDTVVIFSCGLISLSSLTYPMGIILSEKNKCNKKINIFPDSMRNKLVSFTPPFDEIMVRRAIAKTKKMDIEISEKDTSLRILEDYYLSDKALDLPDYSSQATYINYKLWKDVYNHKKNKPDFVYLELEIISSDAAQLDLNNTNSLLNKILFDHKLRTDVILSLNEISGCWVNKKLDLIESKNSLENIRNLMSGSGSHFFWGVNDKGHRVPLKLIGNKLVGIDSSLVKFCFDFNSKNLIQLLSTKKIIPTVFTSLLVISIARGIKSFGGRSMLLYFPEMVSGLTKSLVSNNYINEAKIVSLTPSLNYISGMLSLVTPDAEDLFYPSSMIDLLSNPLIDENLLDSIGKSSFSNTLKNGYLSLYPTFFKNDNCIPNWRATLTKDIKLRKSFHII